MLQFILLLGSCLTLSTTIPHSDGTRVVNGETATIGQFPYQVLLKVQLAQGRALCGGSLLSNQWVLTAGHCVQGAKYAEVTLGAVDFENGETDGRVVLNSTEIVRHEKYNPLFATNDVALIRLPKAVEFHDRIHSVALPSGNNNYVDCTVIVSGWGLQKNGGNVAQKLQFAPLKVISNNQCTKTYNPLVIRKTTICAQGDEKQSPCNGDSGGPLVLEGDNILVGVVSFGHITGCERGLPGAFARVTSFVDWVRKKTGL
ncbi:collagenase-like [Toxorhynchites rutilus septentrionalis]|uniref:collagenase-like n=1 Tax=Toxorhynchites rutilus septentrionalis TaxID=329112 RepID=UPI0024787077|nr:collagenase-like [Toxorhynchites rutilus septentrionalis]